MRHHETDSSTFEPRIETRAGRAARSLLPHEPLEQRAPVRWDRVRQGCSRWPRYRSHPSRWARSGHPTWRSRASSGRRRPRRHAEHLGFTDRSDAAERLGAHAPTPGASTTCLPSRRATSSTASRASHVGTPWVLQRSGYAATGRGGRGGETVSSPSGTPGRGCFRSYRYRRDVTTHGFLESDRRRVGRRQPRPSSPPRQHEEPHHRHLPGFTVSPAMPER